MPIDTADPRSAENIGNTIARRPMHMFQSLSPRYALDMSASDSIAELRRELDAFAWTLVSRFAPSDAGEAEIPLDSDDPTR